MIRPILACENPYETAKIFKSVGWSIDFSQPPESGDPLVGISLFNNSVLLGIVDGYVQEEKRQDIGCGVVFYMTVPSDKIQQIYDNHKKLKPTNIEVRPWGDYAFEVLIAGFQFMIASE